MIYTPILMTGASVRAILHGTKIQTRRVVKLPKWSTGKWKDFELDSVSHSPIAIVKRTGCFAVVESPYGGVGDRLWVKETWCGSMRTMRGYFRADFQYWDHYGNIPLPLIGMPEHCKWTPSLFMPRWASRITLQIVSMRVEKLQDITHMDCTAEGLSHVGRAAWTCPGWVGDPFREGYLGYKWAWESINGKGSWAKNPWVWVITFKKL